MIETCIFRVQFTGEMWRVMESVSSSVAGRYRYRIMHDRKVINKFYSDDSKMAIEQCLKCVFNNNIIMFLGNKQ